MTDLLSRTGPLGERIDPRLAARRAEVARSTGRRRLRRLVVLTVLALVVVGLAGLTRSPLLDVDQLAVSGATRTGGDAVREAAGIDTGRAMVSLDLAAAARRIEALPWVEDATVGRSWPGTVTIAVTERVAVAVVGSGATARLVDRTGRVLGPAPVDAALPGMAGTAPAVGQRLSARSRDTLDTLAGLPAALAAQVADAETTRSGIELVLTDGITVDWGTAGRTAEKAESVRLLLAQADRPTIERIDVSVPSAPALTRRSPGGA